MAEDSSRSDQILKSLVADVVEKLNKIKTFNRRDEINLFCDDLEVEVMERFESAIKHLREIEKELLTEIANYRNELLASTNSPIQANLSTTNEQEPVYVKQLEKLSKEIDSYCNDYFAGSEKFKNAPEIENAQNQARDYLFKLDLLESQIKNETFRMNFMVFEPNHSFCKQSDHIGKIFRRQLPSKESKKKTRIKEKPLSSWTAHSKAVLDMVFFPDGTLATSSQDETIKVWNTEEGFLLYELRSDTGPLHCIELLPNGWLASGSWRGSVHIWDLNEHSLVRSLNGHKFVVISLKVLRNGLLASYSLDDTIRVWNPYLVANNHILTIKDHDNSSCLTLKIGMLSNDHLVSCSCDFYGEEDCILKVWNPTIGTLVKAVSTQSKDAKSLLALSNDQVAVCFKNGSIKIVDLIDQYASKTIGRLGDEFISLLQLPDGNLLTSGKDNGCVALTIWSLSDLRPLQSLFIKTSSSCLSINCSSYQIAAALDEKLVKVWPLDNI